MVPSATAETHPMKQIPLEEFATEKGQAEAARLLGITPPAISKALRVGRAVFVTEHDDGTFTAEELRPFPFQGHQKWAS
ncbi:Cro/Cl family transcriptional regulator [Pseudomonas aeruginosa]|nr:Cro/Cl family transcriptional regulator [Pseudomonas aeruginosa]